MGTSVFGALGVDVGFASDRQRRRGRAKKTTRGTFVIHSLRHQMPACESGADAFTIMDRGWLPLDRMGA